MDEYMKRKQFHLTKEDEHLLKDLAQNKGLSEAEIVREAVREYAAKNAKQQNPLLEMAEEAEKQKAVYTPSDMGVNHDYYLQKLHENEKK